MRNKVLWLGLPIVGVVTFFSLRSPEKGKFIDFRSLKESVEDSTSYFNPTIFSSRHFALQFKIVDYVVSVDSLAKYPLKTIPGKVPRLRGDGELLIRILDSRGNEIDEYFIDDY